MSSIAKLNVSGGAGDRLSAHGSQPEVKTRESGIELLKILSMLFIVIAHICQSAGYPPQMLPEVFTPPIDLKVSTKSIQQFILAFIQHFGAFGNNIFFICSFWFLCKSSQIKLKRFLTIILDVWVLSIIFLLGYLMAGEKLTFSLVLSCVFPVTTGWYWFITCYLLIYLLHPLLNLLMEHMSKKTHLLLCVIAFVLYSGIVFVDSSLLFNSNLIQTMILYFSVGYVRRYLPEWSASRKNNIVLLLFGLLGMLLLLLATNIIGLHIPSLGAELHRWRVNNNPFILMSTFALFNLFRQFHFVSRKINFLSSLTLIIYVTHGNILFRNFTEIRIWALIIEYFGSDMLLLQVVIYAIILFVASCIISALYQATIHKLITRIATSISPKLLGAIDRLSEKLNKIK